MARRRMIDPNIWQSEDFSRLSPIARLLFIGMFSLADDYGKGRGKACYLKSVVFPYDEGIRLIDVEKALSEIGSNMSVTLYSHDENHYYCMNNWRDWQKVDHPSPSKFPDPNPQNGVENGVRENFASDSREIRESFANDSRGFRETLANDSPLIEVKGKEEEKTKTETEKDLSLSSSATQCNDGVVCSSLFGGVGEVMPEEEMARAGQPPPWRTSYEVYLAEETAAYNALRADEAWIAERRAFHPNMDILKTMEKSHIDFWGTPAGWEHKKAKRKIKAIDWKRTFSNALSQQWNKVYKPRYGAHSEETPEERARRINEEALRYRKERGLC